jgi:hypothetical protein
LTTRRSPKLTSRSVMASLITGRSASGPSGRAGRRRAG